MPTYTERQSQDEQSSQKNVSMEITKYMAFPISNNLMLMQMVLDVHLNHGK